MNRTSQREDLVAQRPQIGTMASNIAASLEQTLMTARRVLLPVSVLRSVDRILDTRADGGRKPDCDLS